MSEFVEVNGTQYATVGAGFHARAVEILGKADYTADEYLEAVAAAEREPAVVKGKPVAAFSEDERRRIGAWTLRARGAAHVTYAEALEEGEKIFRGLAAREAAQAAAAAPGSTRPQGRPPSRSLVEANLAAMAVDVELAREGKRVEDISADEYVARCSRAAERLGQKAAA